METARVNFCTAPAENAAPWMRGPPKHAMIMHQPLQTDTKGIYSPLKLWKASQDASKTPIYRAAREMTLTFPRDMTLLQSPGGKLLAVASETAQAMTLAANIDGQDVCKSLPEWMDQVGVFSYYTRSAPLDHMLTNDGHVHESDLAFAMSPLPAAPGHHTPYVNNGVMNFLCQNCFWEQMDPAENGMGCVIAMAMTGRPMFHQPAIMVFVHARPNITANEYMVARDTLDAVGTATVTQQKCHEVIQAFDENITVWIEDANKEKKMMTPGYPLFLTLAGEHIEW